MRFHVLLGAMAALVLAYVGYWFYVAHETERALAAWIAEGRAAGLEIAENGLAVGGFPFRIRVDATAPAIARPEARLGWSAERLAVIMQPWKLHHALAELDGRHTLRLPDGAGERIVELGFETALASLLADRSGGWQQIGVNAEALTVTLADGEGGAVLRDAALYLRPSVREDAFVDLVVKSGRTRLEGAGLAPPLDTPLDRIEVDLTLNGAVPFAGQAVRRTIVDWRDAGGTIDLHRLVLRQGRFRLEVTGTLALDAQLRPLGALTAKVTGHADLIALLVAAGQMPPGQAASATLALDLLAVAGGGSVAAPLTLQDGEMRLGPVVLGRLRPLRL